MVGLYMQGASCRLTCCHPDCQQDQNLAICSCCLKPRCPDHRYVKSSVNSSLIITRITDYRITDYKIYIYRYSRCLHVCVYIYITAHIHIHICVDIITSLYIYGLRIICRLQIPMDYRITDCSKDRDNLEEPSR